jgi:hypothetical protein
VLVLVASAAGPPFGLLPSWWCLRTYRSLSRPFKKHVRFVVLVQPNMFVRAILTLLTPFLSPKAHTKIKQVGDKWTLSHHGAHSVIARPCRAGSGRTHAGVTNAGPGWCHAI